MKASASWNLEGNVWNGVMWLAVVAVLACVLVPFICGAMDACQKIKDQMDQNGHAGMVAICLDRSIPWT